MVAQPVAALAHDPAQHLVAIALVGHRHTVPSKPPCSIAAQMLERRRGGHRAVAHQVAPHAARPRRSSARCRGTSPATAPRRARPRRRLRGRRRGCAARVRARRRGRRAPRPSPSRPAPAARRAPRPARRAPRGRRARRRTRAGGWRQCPATKRKSPRAAREGGEAQRGFDAALVAARGAELGDVVGGDRLVGGDQDGEPDEFLVVRVSAAGLEGQRGVGCVVGLEQARRGDRKQAVMGQQVAALGAHARRASPRPGGGVGQRATGAVARASRGRYHRGMRRRA